MQEKTRTIEPGCKRKPAGWLDHPGKAMSKRQNAKGKTIQLYYAVPTTSTIDISKIQSEHIRFRSEMMGTGQKVGTAWFS